MRGIVVTTENVAFVRDFEPPIYSSVGEVVGGHIEIVNPIGLTPPFCMIVNEEFIALNLQRNRLGCALYGTPTHGYPIQGNIVIMQLCRHYDGYDVTGIPEEKVQEVVQELVKTFPSLKVGTFGGEVDG